MKLITEQIDDLRPTASNNLFGAETEVETEVETQPEEEETND